MPRDPFDFIDAISAAEDKDRRDRMVVDAQASMRAEAARAKEAKARVDATTRRANESYLRFEYSKAGVDPPFVDGRGVPTVSLSFLLKIGWRVERMGRDAVLVRPAAFPPVRKQSEV